MAKRKRHTAAEIAAKLGQADALAAEGQSQAGIAKALGISVMTFHRWRNAKSQMPHSNPISGQSSNKKPPLPTGLSDSERLARIAELQLENTRLRKLVTDLLLEKMRLEEETRQSPRRFAKTA